MSTFDVRGRYDQYTVGSVPGSKGGVGSIHRTTDPRWVYKQYFDPAKAPSLQHLDRLIGIGRDVLIRDGHKPGQTPESSVNWPVDVSVDANEAVQGVILPAIPPSLFNEYDSVRGLEFLVMARANPPSAKGRVALLLRMAEILNFIDSRGLVHGDINGKQPGLGYYTRADHVPDRLRRNGRPGSAAGSGRSGHGLDRSAGHRSPHPRARQIQRPVLPRAGHVPRPSAHLRQARFETARRKLAGAQGDSGRPGPGNRRVAATRALRPAGFLLHGRGPRTG